MDKLTEIKYRCYETIRKSRLVKPTMTANIPRVIELSQGLLTMEDIYEFSNNHSKYMLEYDKKT